MASSSILDRFTSPRNRTPILPIHGSPKRPPSEYQLDELDPCPDLVPFEELPRARQRRTIAPEMGPRITTTPWDDRSSSAGSSSKRKPRPMFAGPPPPITSSMMVRKNASPSSPSGRAADNSPGGAARGSRLGLGSLLLNQTPEHAPHNADSVWRGLRRQEKALERDIQDLLDLQAAGLVAGSGALGGGPSSSDADAYSDTGSSTPTGTFYSTATSKSRMVNSLYVPTRSTPDGNVIPVRQPARTRPRGLRSSRNGLRKSMASLVSLKREEDAHIDAALSQRKQALVHLDRLSSRRAGIRNELQILEQDEEEPLGKELRDLSEKHDSLDQDIRRLEERLIGMRNRRRWLREKMDHVKNKREAGLSGYRGALRDVDTEVTSLMQRPPIQPLDSEMLGRDDESGTGSASPGGSEFMRLIPERRTAEMARTWWQGEISMLEQRKSQINTDRQALEEGGAVWEAVMALVTDFEASLRQLMKASISSSSGDKQSAESQEDVIRDQLPHMDGVVAKLEEHMQLAEEKHWNLLICAIGAELDAFKEAQGMLRSIFEPVGDGTESTGVEGSQEQSQSVVIDAPPSHEHHEESDNEVPSDLLVSHAEETGRDDVLPAGAEAKAPQAASAHGDSEDEVPAEFLAEHDSSSEA